MGGPMARNLVAAGHEVQVFDLVPAALERCAAAGCTPVASAAAAASGVELFFSMLPAGKHVDALYLGEAGLVGMVDAGTLLVDCSTIDPATAKKVAAAVAQRGIAMLDAPVSGGTAGAENGTLTFMVGGPDAALKLAQAAFEVMGKNVFHAGANGAGQTAKVCNNMLLAVHMTGTAEALALGVRGGRDPGVLSEIMRQSSGGNWSLEVYNPYPGVMPGVPASRDYAGGFLVDHMTKDLRLAKDTAEETGAAVPMGALARNLFRLHAQQNAAGQLDFSSIQQLFDKT
jgi:3-hydroxyisobutyrate dehydrogenase